MAITNYDLNIEADEELEPIHVLVPKSVKTNFLKILERKGNMSQKSFICQIINQVYKQEFK